MKVFVYKDYIYESLEDLKDFIVQEKSFEGIKKSLIEEGLSDELLLKAEQDFFEKGRTGIYGDNSTNRRLKRVGQPYGSKKQQEVPKGKKTAKKEESGGKKQPIEEQAKNATGSSLETASTESKDSKVREAAHKELERREKEEKPQQEEETGEKVKEKSVDKEKKEPEGQKKEEKDGEKEKETDLTGKYLKASEVETGKPVKMSYTHNTERSPMKTNQDFGQKLEPHGKYITNNPGTHKIDGWEYNEIEFKNPLVLEHISTSSKGWKGELFNKFGKKGAALSKELIKRGYDAIITVDSQYDELSEIVSLKDFDPDFKKKGDKGNDLDTKEGIEKEIKELRAKDTDDIEEITELSDKIDELRKKFKELTAKEIKERRDKFKEKRKEYADMSNKDMFELEEFYEKGGKKIKEYLQLNFLQEKSLGMYVEDGFESIREYLTTGKVEEETLSVRGGDFKVTEESVKMVSDSLSKFIDDNKIQENMSLNRRVKGDKAVNFFKSLGEGDIYEDKSFSSTSLEEIGIFGNFNIEILAKKGSNVANADNSGETEYLIDKNSKYKVLDKTDSGIIVELL